MDNNISPHLLHYPLHNYIFFSTTIWKKVPLFKRVTEVVWGFLSECCVDTIILGEAESFVKNKRFYQFDCM